MRIVTKCYIMILVYIMLNWSSPPRLFPLSPPFYPTVCFVFFSPLLPIPGFRSWVRKHWGDKCFQVTSPVFRGQAESFCSDSNNMITQLMQPELEPLWPASAPSSSYCVSQSTVHKRHRLRSEQKKGHGPPKHRCGNLHYHSETVTIYVRCLYFWLAQQDKLSFFL